MTEWARIPFLPERVEASKSGDIRTGEYEIKFVNSYGTRITRRQPQRILKQRINNRPPSSGKHLVVGIYRGQNRENSLSIEYRVAYLVAAAHLGVPFDRSDMSVIQKWRIRFKDGDVSNCAADNLEWVHRVGTNISGGGAQQMYEENLDTFREQSLENVMARLFGDAA